MAQVISTEIEVSRNTFLKLFQNDNITGLTDFVTSEQKETHVKEYYYNPILDQKGFRIFNYVSSCCWQYYLTDINA